MPTNQNLVDDPSVKMPRAVREAAARADALFNTYRDNPEEQEATSEVTPPELDPASLAQPQQEEQEEQEEQQQETQPTHESVEDDGTWEHKYKSMHGRYTSLQDQYRGLSDQVTNLQNVIATMQQPGNVPELNPASFERLITPEEETDYGKDLLNVVGRRAKEELAPIITAQSKQIERLTETIKGMAGTSQVNAQRTMLSQLDEKMPDWRMTNTNPEFLEWLRLPDAYSGAIRHDMLKAAYAAGNASRVLAFFNGFLNEEAVTAPVETQPEPGTTRVPRIPLKNLAAPGRAKNGASNNGAPPDKPVISRAQIASFYAEVAAGKYRGKEPEKQRLEGMIFSAQAEGRIR